MPPESAKLTRGSFTKFLHSSSPPVPFCFCSFRLATEEPARTQVVERLADAGATVDARDLAQWTPLHHAALKGRTDAALALLRCSCGTHPPHMRRAKTANRPQMHGAAQAPNSA
jgi:hypothetical protein